MILHQTHRLDRLHRPTDVVLIARRARKHQRIDDHILRGDPVLACQQLDAPPRHLQLPLPRERLRLHRVLVDRPYHQRRPVSPRNRAHRLKLLFPVLQIHRIDDRLALTVRQRLLHRHRVRCIDHHRSLDLADQPVVKRIDIRHLVPVARLQTHVHDVRPVPHLPPRDLARLLPLLIRHQVFEQPRPYHVRPFAHNQRTRLLVRLHHLNPAEQRPRLPARLRPRLVALHHLRNRPDMIRRRPATPAHNIQPPVHRELLQLRRQRIRRLPIVAIDIRQTRIRVTRYPHRRHLVNRPDVIRHELRPRRAVQPDRQQRRVLHAHHQRVRRLPPQHRPRRLNRPRHDHRRYVPALLRRLFRPQQRRLDIPRVLARLHQQHIRAPLQQPQRLPVIALAQLRERRPSRHRDRLRRRPDRTRHESRPPRRRKLLRRLPREPRRQHVHFVDLRLHPKLRQRDRMPPERIRLHQIRPCREIRPVHVPDPLRLRIQQILRAILKLRPAPVLNRRVVPLQHRPHRAVQHQNARTEGVQQRLSAFVTVAHGVNPSL